MGPKNFNQNLIYCDKIYFEKSVHDRHTKFIYAMNIIADIILSNLTWYQENQ